jgi:surface antigen
VSRSRFALAVLFFAALLVPTAPAHAAYTMLCTGYASCTDKGYSSSGYSAHKGTSYWNMYTGTNCTNYVAYRLVTTNGMPNKRPKAGVGNAQDWGTAMASVTDSRPSVGSVAWWGRTGRHVAYVEKVVSSTEVWVSESNWSGAFDWRKITKSGSGWPDGFIHFSDQVLKNTARPTLGGTPTVGEALSPSVGKWTVMGNKYVYQWTADGKAIAGATAKSYTPTPAVVGKDLALKVTASRSGWDSGTASSTASEVQPGTVAPGTPSVSGSARVDEPLTASPGVWSPTPTTFSYQWSVAGTPVAGATSTTFVPRPADAGRAVNVSVTGVRTGYVPAASTSPAVTISAGELRSTAPPAVTGTPAVGARLAADPGTWSGSGLSYDYQWLVAGTPVPGATSSTYTPVAADHAKTVSVRVAAHGVGYSTTSATSAPSAKVATGTFSAPSPTIVGAIRLGSTPSIDPGTPPVPGATATFQWLRDGVAKAKATAASRTIIASDLGKKLSGRVTWSAPGYDPVTVTSAATAAAKATAALKVTATPAKGKVTFAVSLSATGLASPDASIVVARRGGGHKTFTIKAGRGSYTLKGQSAGTSTYTLTYAGTSTITSATTTLTSRIK